ncbi:hypothetical protein JCM10207_005841 [Rhodosporidiobolus poonsookiae]
MQHPFRANEDLHPSDVAFGRYITRLNADKNVKQKLRDTVGAAYRRDVLTDNQREDLGEIDLHDPVPDQRTVRTRIDKLNAPGNVKEMLKDRILILYTQNKLSDAEKKHVATWTKERQYGQPHDVNSLTSALSSITNAGKRPHFFWKPYQPKHFNDLIYRLNAM